MNEKMIVRRLIELIEQNHPIYTRSELCAIVFVKYPTDFICPTCGAEVGEKCRGLGDGSWNGVPNESPHARRTMSEADVQRALELAKEHGWE